MILNEQNLQYNSNKKKRHYKNQIEDYKTNNFLFLF